MGRSWTLGQANGLMGVSPNIKIVGKDVIDPMKLESLDLDTPLKS